MMHVFLREFVRVRVGRWGVALAASLMAAALSMVPAAAAPAGAIITVNTLLDSAPGADGICTLREAIVAANTNTASGATAGECAAGANGLDRIEFSVGGTITPASDLPAITRPVLIDGDSTTRLDGGDTLANGFVFDPGSGGSTLHNFVVTNFATGVSLKGGKVSLTDNYIGTADGTTAASNEIGVKVESSGNRIGLIATGGVVRGNLISGNLTGVSILGGSKNILQANRIGTDASKVNPLGNVEGVVIGETSSTLIGGTKANEGNFISGNTGDGIVISALAKNTKITRNAIGLGGGLTPTIPNDTGILDLGSKGTVIGGKMTSSGNFITGNTGVSILLSGAAPGGKVTITGNIIGRTGSGSYPANAVDGIRIEAAYSKLAITNNIIGNHEYAIREIADPGPMTFSGNCLFANDFGAVNFGAPMKAAKNWWGDDKGPFHPVTNPAAFGDEVSDGVIYQPYLAKEGPACAGFAAKLTKPKDFSFSLKSGSPTTFLWGKVPTASGYSIQLEGVASGVLANNVSTGTQTKFTTAAPLDYDQYDWTIISTTPDGVAWPSQGRMWVTIMSSPLPEARINAGMVTFKWAKFTGAANYTWRLYEVNETDPYCSVILDTAVINAPGTSHVANVGSGDFSWSVKPDNGPEMPCWFIHTP